VTNSSVKEKTRSDNMTHKNTNEDEFLEEIKKRAETPLEEYILYEGPEKMYERLMKRKEELGLKFKDEK